jgi:hypothetical protein
LADGRTLALVIVHKGDAIKLDGEVDKAGTKSELHFDCKMDGSDCEFTESTHKSKMSVWIVSGTVTACKTNGPPGDASTEWHMKVSSDGNTMTVDVEHVDPTAAAESMVFTKKPA